MTKTETLAMLKLLNAEIEKIECMIEQLGNECEKMTRKAA